MVIRNVVLEDAPALCDIYNYYIECTAITFEEQILTESAFSQRIQTISSSYPWLVIEENNQILGYAYAGEWKSRSAFRYTVESSIYLHPQAPGRQGIGESLYRRLLSLLAERGFHRVIAAITVPNENSIALHKKLEFEEAGYFGEVGYKFQRWIDVIYMELRLPQAVSNQISSKTNRTINE
jgi:phosphinothricin acetyltransferase